MADEHIYRRLYRIDPSFIGMKPPTTKAQELKIELFLIKQSVGQWRASTRARRWYRRGQ